MWYPLNNSLFALSLTAIALAIVLGIARQSAALPAETSDTSIRPIEHAVELMGQHLLIADRQQHAQFMQSIRTAVSQHAESQLGRPASSAARHSAGQATMPFFSFGRFIDRKREGSA